MWVSSSKYEVSNVAIWDTTMTQQIRFLHQILPNLVLAKQLTKQNSLF